MTKDRNLTFDIAKTICIGMMVVGYSGCPEHLRRFVNMIDIPCFLFVSGWLLKERYLNEVKTVIIKRVKRTYLPYVAWSVVFLLLHNVFSTIFFYNTRYSSDEIHLRFFRIAMMKETEQLLDGYWLLVLLFIASVISIFLLALLRRRGGLNSMNVTGIIFTFLIMASLQVLIPFHLPRKLSEPILFAIALYLSGYICHKWDLNISHPLYVGILMIAIPALSAILNYSSDGRGWYVIPDFILAIIGTIGILIISNHLANCRIAKVIAYIGENTIYILTFFLLSFKIVNIPYLLINDLPTAYMTQFPTMSGAPSWMWMVLTIAGIVLPLIISLTVETVKELRNINR
jgi:fucose 4-O-acetylase-like acetyltransferase